MHKETHIKNWLLVKKTGSQFFYTEMSTGAALLLTIGFMLFIGFIISAYLHANLVKLDEYRRNGIYPGKNLIITYEGKAVT